MKYFFNKRRAGKYGSATAYVDGIRFQSKLERDTYLVLKKQKDDGDIKFFLRQVPFELTANIVYRADFLVFYTNGLVEVIDSKGFETDIFKMKKKMLEELYDIELKIVKKNMLNALMFDKNIIKKLDK